MEALLISHKVTGFSKTLRGVYQDANKIDINTTLRAN